MNMLHRVHPLAPFLYHESSFFPFVILYRSQIPLHVMISHFLDSFYCEGDDFLDLVLRDSHSMDTTGPPIL